ncbi:hypothetical protein DF048_28010 [Burkholderia seminalis]|nr:hypothetical protein DF048_28010 [Burkholderia seminalis]
MGSSARLARSGRRQRGRAGGASGALELAVSHGGVASGKGWVVAFGWCVACPLLVRSGGMLPDRHDRRGEPDRAVFRHCARAPMRGIGRPV